jgi:plastocyanin
MKTALTGSLVVCVAAAGIAVGALALEPGTPAAPAAQPPTVPAPPAGAPAAPGNGPYGGGGSTPAPAAATVQISDFTYSVPAATSGSSVAVSNLDGVPHTVTADDGSFRSGTVDGGATGTFVAPAAPGTYQFHCEIHPQMSGSLTVG